MAFNIAPDESRFRAYPWTAALGQPRARRNKYRKLLRPHADGVPASDGIDRPSRSDEPKHRHEYFPNLPEPKGFSHGPPASRRQKSRDDGSLNVMSASTNMDSNLAAFREDRGELKRDVASLIEHFRGEATNRVQNAAAPIDRAGKERRFLRRAVNNRLPCIAATR